MSVVLRAIVQRAWGWPPGGVGIGGAGFASLHCRLLANGRSSLGAASWRPPPFTSFTAFRRAACEKCARCLRVRSRHFSETARAKPVKGVRRVIRPNPKKAAVRQHRRRATSPSPSSSAPFGPAVQNATRLRIRPTFRQADLPKSGKTGDRAMGGPHAAVEANGTLTRKRDTYPHQSTFAYKINISEAEPLNFRHSGKPRRTGLVGY